MYGSLNLEFGLRKMKKSHALAMENEGEEEKDEREKDFWNGVEMQQNPYI